MNSKKNVLCNVFGHDWEHLQKNDFRQPGSRSSQLHSKRCLRCGKREATYDRMSNKWLLYS